MNDDELCTRCGDDELRRACNRERMREYRKHGFFTGRVNSPTYLKRSELDDE